MVQGARENDLSYVEAVARLVSEKGMEMEKTLMSLDTDNGNKFRFLWRSDPRHAFYKQNLKECQQQHRDEAANQQPEDCVGDDYDDCVHEPLPSNGKPSFRLPPSITLQERGIIKLTALFVARYDMYFLRGLNKILSEREHINPQFEFLKPTHSRFKFYEGLVTAYSSVIRPRRESLMMNDPYARAIFDVFFHHLQLEKLEEGDAMAMIDLHAFVSGVDLFAHVEDANFRPRLLPRLWNLSEMMTELTEMHPPPLGKGFNPWEPFRDGEEPDPYGYPPQSLLLHSYRFLRNGITLKEFGVIKLTAMFVVRYGAAFRNDLMDRVATSHPLFEFLKQNDRCSRSKVFILLVDAYSTVLRLSPKLWSNSNPACAMAFLEFFARCLQLKKLEDGVEMVTVDLHALVSGVDCFAHIDEKIYCLIMPRPKRLSTIMNRLGSQLNQDLEAQKQELDRAHDEYLAAAAAKTHFLDWFYIRAPGQFRFPAKGFTLKELGTVMLTALFHARYGDDFLTNFKPRVVVDTRFDFLKVDDRRRRFFLGLVDAYCLVLKPFEKLKNGDARTETVLEVFFSLVQSEEGIGLVDVVDCFVHVDDENYSLNMPAPVHLLMDMIPPTLKLPGTHVLPPPVTSLGDLKPHTSRTPPPHDLAFTCPEPCIIKVTAQFVARYGMDFTRALMERVGEKPLFEFMDLSDSRFDSYRKLVDDYSRVLLPCKSKRKLTDTVLEVFFRCLDMATIGLHGFVGVVDCFAHIDDILVQPCQVHHDHQRPPMIQPTPVMSPTEPKPKRQKFDESDLVPQDRFLAQHFQGSFTIRVFVPSVGEVVIRK